MERERERAIFRSSVLDILCVRGFTLASKSRRNVLVLTEGSVKQIACVCNSEHCLITYVSYLPFWISKAAAMSQCGSLTIVNVTSFRDVPN